MSGLFGLGQRIDSDCGAVGRSHGLGWGRRLLGYVGQDLSRERAQAICLLETPEFLGEFILDRTLGRTVDEFGLCEVGLIDPAGGFGRSCSASAADGGGEGGAGAVRERAGTIRRHAETGAGIGNRPGRSCGRPRPGRRRRGALVFPPGGPRRRCWASSTSSGSTTASSETMSCRLRPGTRCRWCTRNTASWTSSAALEPEVSEGTGAPYSDVNANGVDGQEQQANVLDGLLRTLAANPSVVYGAFFRATRSWARSVGRNT